MYFIGHLSLEGLLKTHRDEKSPIYLAPWGLPGGDSARDPCVLAADMQEGIARYCLMTQSEAVAFTGSGADCESIKKRIERKFQLSVEDAVLSLPTHHYLQVAGGGTLLAGDMTACPPIIPKPDMDERGRARYEAIRPLLDAQVRTTAAVSARANRFFPFHRVTAGIPVGGATKRLEPSKCFRPDIPIPKVAMLKLKPIQSEAEQTG
mgnify:CR=1 FL=1